MNCSPNACCIAAISFLLTLSPYVVFTSILLHISGVLGAAFAYGMGLMVTAWAFGRISGAHFNPAITLACLIAGNLRVTKAIMYLICQLLGACLGVVMARGTTPNNADVASINYLVSCDKRFCIFHG